MTEKTEDNKKEEKDTKKAKGLNDKIKDLEVKIVELENNWKRALADYQNLQKRTAEEKLSFVSFANSNVIRKLLPILDNLEMVQKHINDEGISMINPDYSS